MSTKYDKDGIPIIDRELYSGVSPLRKLKRSDSYCPRCNAKKVSRVERRCLQCQGAVYWDGDDCQNSIDRHEDFYVWHTTIFGLTGWVHKSFLGFDMIAHPMKEATLYDRQ